MTQATPRPMPDLLAYSPRTAARILPFDPFDEEFLADPYPVYRRIRAAAGNVLRTSENSVAVLGFEEASAVLKDPRFGIGAEPITADQFLAGPSEDESGRLLMFVDPPDHTRLRGLVSKAFTPRTMEDLRPFAAGHAERMLRTAADSSPDGVFDLMAEFGRALPATVLGRLLDIPERYFPMFFAAVKESARALDPGFLLTAEQKAGRDAARQVFIQAGLELAAQRRERPGTDLISDLARAEQAGDRLTEWELAMLMIILLAAGFGGTAGTLGNGVLALLTNPEQLAWLRRHPDQVAGAAEELIRYDPFVTATTRMALRDADIGGLPVAAGDHVIVLLGAANRDPAVFDHPDALDLSRPPGRSLSFGLGIHFCLAAPMARMVIQTALTALLDYDLALAGGPVERWPAAYTRLVGTLPIRATRRAR